MLTVNKRIPAPLSILLIFIVVLLCLFFRRQDAFTYPQFWAEDGAIFFKQAETLGISAIWKPYNGYLHFTPRIIAFLAALLKIPFQQIPAFYNWGAFMVMFLIALHLWKTSVYIGVRHRIAYAVFFVFLPLSSEIFMTITNINWFTSVFIINFLFVRYTDRGAKNYFATLALLALSGLTGPFSAILLPIVLLSLFLDRKTMTLRSAAPLLVLLVCGIVQAVYIKFIDVNIYRSYPGNTESWHLLKLVTNNINQMFLLDHVGMNDHLRMVICILLALLLVALLIKSYGNIAVRHKYVLPLTGLMLMAAFVKTYWPNESLIPALDNSRYYFVPYMCMFWILFVAADSKLKIWHGIIGLCYFIALHRHVVMRLPDQQWKRQVVEYQQGIRDTFNIPPDWKFTIDKPRQK